MRGFTLVDTLVSAGMMVLLAVAISALVVTAASLERSARTYTSLVEEARRALDRIERDVRTVRPNKFQATYPGGQGYAAGGDNMGFVSCLDPNGRVVTDSQGRVAAQEWVVYFCNARRLLRSTTREGNPTVDSFMPPALQRALIRSGSGEVVAAPVDGLKYSVEDGMLLYVDLTIVNRKSSGATYDYIYLTRKIRTNVGWDSANF